MDAQSLGNARSALSRYLSQDRPPYKRPLESHTALGNLLDCRDTPGPPLTADDFAHRDGSGSEKDALARCVDLGILDKLVFPDTSLLSKTHTSDSHRVIDSDWLLGPRHVPPPCRASS